MRISCSLVSLAAALTCAACIPPPAAGTTASAPGATAAPAADDTTAPAAPSDGSGPPALRRFIPGLEAQAAAPYHRGDYLVGLDYRDEGLGTYGFLYDGDNRWWVVEQDQVVGGPLADGGPEMERVVAAWRQASQQRHQAVMNGIANLPHGCLDGCAFDVHQDGQYQGTRIVY